MEKWEKTLIIIIAIAVGWLIWKARQPKELGMANPGTEAIAIGNNPLQLEQAKPRLLAMKVVVKSAGTPVRFPYGKPVTGKMKFNTRGNTGVVFLGDSPSTVADGILRFSVAKDKDFDYEVSELSNLWLDADNDNDYIEIMGDIEG